MVIGDNSMVGLVYRPEIEEGIPMDTEKWIWYASEMGGTGNRPIQRADLGKMVLPCRNCENGTVFHNMVKLLLSLS